MVEPVKTRERAAAWRPWAAVGRRPVPQWLVLWAHLLGRTAQQLRAWVLVDAGPGRLAPWLAVAFGIGIIVYFAAEREPALWAGPSLLVGAIVIAVLTRHRPVAFPIMVGIAAVAAGFTAATVKRTLIAHPVLSAPVWGADVAGFVEVREERERSDRIVVRVTRIAGPRLNETLERVRVSVRKGTAPPVGSFVEFKARLSPPLSPLRPGGYDFARDMYFQGLGASGFVLGRIRLAEPDRAPPSYLRYATTIDGMREAIDERIRAVVPGDAGAIASALITGKRDALSAPVFDAMYASGIGHILSISGYHMALVAGIIFFVLRASFALMRAFTGRHPIKKWAAFAALGGAAFYLLLSGAEVATQRSFIMIAIVLIGVMVDRQTLTVRTLMVAALGVLLIAPEAVVHPSFQMSFAATLALVAGYQQGLPWMSRSADTPLGARIALWGGREIVGLIIVSLLAGTATIPFVAYHFHRISSYGVLANLLAMPIISGWVMPAGILGMLALPFGLDGYCWKLMGSGIEWMVTIALWVTSLPGAVGRMAAFGIAPLLIGTAGLVLVCLLKTPLRLTGLALIGVATVMAMRTPQPDVLVAPEGSAFAIRTPSGRLALIKSGSDTFAFRDWLMADADRRDAKDKALNDGIRCDPAGCVARLADNAIVAIANSAEAFAEDCRRAAVVLSAGAAPPGCGALVIDREMLRRTGAVALRRVGEGFEVTPSRPPGYDRPWAPARSDENEQGQPGTARRQPRDATPNVDDLEPGD